MILMIKILQVISSMIYGGTEAYVMNNLRNIDLSEFKIDFYITDIKYIEPNYINELKKYNANIYYGINVNLKNYFKFKKDFLKVLKNGKYDGVHSHLNISNYKILRYSKKMKIPVRISHSHAIMENQSNLLRKIFYLYRRNIIKGFRCRN